MSFGAIAHAVVLFWLLLFYRSDFIKMSLYHKNVIMQLCLSLVTTTVVHSCFLLDKTLSCYSPMAGVLGAAAPFLIGALWGVGDGMMNTELNAVVGLLFEDSKVIYAYGMKMMS